MSNPKVKDGHRTYRKQSPWRCSKCGHIQAPGSPGETGRLVRAFNDMEMMVDVHLCPGCAETVSWDGVNSGDWGAMANFRRKRGD